ncbi:protein kinase [Streptomyces sp. NPDC006602]|uniref:protein kinase n=1 Tax=Streptomyces sp. NPDC006602 TaxID=3364751 RepID=UPI00368C9853
MDDYAGRVLADRYRLPLPPADEYELTESRAFDTYSGQEVLVRQVPLPEVVEAEVLDAEGLPDGFTARDPYAARERGARRAAVGAAARRPADPAVRRAVEAAQAAARIPDHPRLDQVFDVFADGGSLWIVSELVPARPLAALLAEKPLTPYRAAEVASDVLMALRVLHAHGWVHRNITARTVLVCDDGRVMLTGLAVGAAEEALCGYDPVPAEAGEWGAGDGDFGDGGVGGGAEAGGPGARGGREAAGGPGGAGGFGRAGHAGAAGGIGRVGGAGGGGGADGARGVGGAGVAGRSDRGRGISGGGAIGPVGRGGVHGAAGTAGAAGSGGLGGVDPEAARRAAIEAREAEGLPAPGAESGSASSAGASSAVARRDVDGGLDIRAARAGAIAAYRAGARAAARVQEAQQSGRTAVPGARPAPEGDPAAAHADGSAEWPYPAADGGQQAPYPAANAGQQAPYPAANGAGQLPYSAASGGQQQAPYPAANGGQQQPYPSANGAQQPPYPAPNGAQRPPHAAANGSAQGAYPGASGVQESGGGVSPGQIADPYGVRASSWHGAVPRGGVGGVSATPGGGASPAGGVSAAGPGATAAGVPAPSAYGVPAPVSQGSPAAALSSGGSAPSPSRWDELAAGTPVRRGPTTALAAERARQARMAVVGPVTERWAPEQAGPVHENWQLAAPIGPQTDLWALGALLFRAVQGHAPYPEESTAELVQLVCAEPPAFAEECGPLRPVVESLLRQDPTERLDFEELRGWLRSLVRSAPEPEAGAHVVAAPPADTSRLPVVRRRGELVRRRRAGLPATSAHGRHKRAREEARSPRSLGRTLLLLILLVLAGAIAYAMFFMPKADPSDQGAGDRTGAAGEVSNAPEQSPEASSEPRPDQTSPEPAQGSTSASAGSTQTQTAGPEVADGFTLRKDTAGFQVAVANGWERTGENGRGQVVYTRGNFELILVPGRDSAAEDGSDPMVYQREKEPELQPYRDSSWATATGLKTIQVGGRTMAEGQFTWTGDDGRELFVRNLALLADGKYHVVQVRGPEAERDEVTRLYEEAAETYQVTG